MDESQAQEAHWVTRQHSSLRYENSMSDGQGGRRLVKNEDGEIGRGQIYKVDHDKGLALKTMGKQLLTNFKQKHVACSDFIF